MVTRGLLYLFFVVNLIGCSNEPDPYFRAYNTIEFPAQYTRADTVLRSPYQEEMFTIVLPFLKDGDTIEVVTENLAGLILYQNYYHQEFVSYNVFLEQLFSRKKLIASEHLSDVLHDFNSSLVIPENKIMTEYRKYGFGYILKKYTKNAGNVFFQESYYDVLKGFDETAFRSIMYKHKYFSLNYGLLDKHIYVKNLTNSH